MYVDSVNGEGAVQKEEDMASHPQQILCRELKSHNVQYICLHFQHYMLFQSRDMIKTWRTVPTTTSFTPDLVPSFLTLSMSSQTLNFRSLT